jgi:hypothetical protein
MLALALRTGTLVAAVAVAGCGKYIPPIPPEMVAPKEVQVLEVFTTPSQVGLKWQAPNEDRRGQELKTIDGYTVQRKEIAVRGDETNPNIEFADLGFVKDTHIQVRERLRNEAREQGKIGRAVKAPAELTHFSFIDSKPQNGKTYLYQVVPQNQGGVDGVIKQVVKVVFKGEASNVVVLAAKDVEASPEPEDNLPVGQQ